MKKSISMLLVFSMMVTTFMTPIQAKNDESLFNYTGETSTLIIDEMAIDITSDKKDNIRTATISENNGEKITTVQINDITKVMTVNGEIIDNIDTTVSELPLIDELTWTARSNWSDPTVSIVTCNVTATTTAIALGWLFLKCPLIPFKTAQYILTTAIGLGANLYIKSVDQYNYVDYAPKVGYRHKESVHLTEECDGISYWGQEMNGSRSAIIMTP